MSERPGFDFGVAMGWLMPRPQSETLNLLQQAYDAGREAGRASRVPPDSEADENGEAIMDARRDIEQATGITAAFFDDVIAKLLARLKCAEEAGEEVKERTAPDPGTEAILDWIDEQAGPRAPSTPPPSSHGSHDSTMSLGDSSGKAVLDELERLLDLRVACLFDMETNAQRENFEDRRSSFCSQRLALLNALDDLGAVRKKMVRPTSEEPNATNVAGRHSPEAPTDSASVAPDSVVGAQRTPEGSEAPRVSDEQDVGWDRDGERGRNLGQQGEARSLAESFHEAYERLAPEYGYETRTETRRFDPDTPNGRLMIHVCGEMLAALSARSATPEGSRLREAEDA